MRNIDYASAWRAAQLLFVVALWAIYLATELWKARQERCTASYFIAYGTQARCSSYKLGRRGVCMAAVVCRVCRWSAAQDSHQGGRVYAQRDHWWSACGSVQLCASPSRVPARDPSTRCCPLSQSCQVGNKHHTWKHLFSSLWRQQLRITTVGSCMRAPSDRRGAPPAGDSAAGRDGVHDLAQGAQDAAPPAAHGPRAGRHHAQRQR
jgi:hypothetical protein